MKKYSVSIVLLICSYIAHAQESPGLELNCEKTEALFLENNLALMAGKYNIAIADAAIIQARLWDNPSLSISGINLWSTKSQRSSIEDIATSSFVKNTDFSIELSQLIQTANKRGKLVRREKVAKEIAMQEFEELLRGLKTELRKSVYELHYSQSYMNILLTQRQSVNQLIEAYRKLVQQGNMAKSELIRLQSSLLELEGEINSTRLDLTEQEKTLKVLLNIDPFTRIAIVPDPKKVVDYNRIALSHIIETAEESRPDMKQYRLRTQYHQKNLAYEKSLQIPDITLGASYDRYGGIWKDYIGIGISVDLPLFNRNRGNIKAAQLSIEQSRYIERQQQNIVRHEVVSAYNNYVCAYDFYRKTADESLLSELDEMLDVYAKNVVNKNISMLEYIDFTESYRASKQTMFKAQKDVDIQFEELQYIVGTEIR